MVWSARFPHTSIIHCLFLLVCLLQVCGTSWGEDPQSGDARSDESAGIRLLRQIEQRVLPFPLVDGVPRNESLSDYYWDANAALKYRFVEAVTAFTTGEPATYRKLTLVAGSAGIGKTFLKRSVATNSIPPEQTWKLDVRELFQQLAGQRLAEMKPDVCHGDTAISQLLSLTAKGRGEFSRLIETRTAPFVVVDSLDEVHPDDYFFVLAELERLALAGDQNFIHVVVFGRPLVFRDYWAARRSEGMPAGLQSFALNPPDFRTTGDLRVSSWNYNCWKYGLGRVGVDGQTHPMSFPDFQRWFDRGFPRSGEFANVWYRENHSLRRDVCDELEGWTKQHRVVMAVLPNLAGNSIVREMVEHNVEAGQEFDERQFMEEFFTRWLERDTKSCDRPSQVKPQHLQLYIKLLEAVATKYVDEQRVSRLGYFDVVDDDRVVVEHDGEKVSVPVRRLLNRSGLVTLDPVLPVAQRYRFEPFWLHRLLLTMHEERNASDHGLRSPSAIKLSDKR